MATKISSKYDHIKKALIQPGSPKVWKLIPREEKIGTPTKMTLGERNLEKMNKTILLVGETGTGKSTLINALVNYAMGVEWEDDVWFQIVEDEKRSQSESQTSDVMVYQIFGFEDKTLPYSLTIIDTPGYGDTRGTEQDAIVSQRLLDLFRSKEGVHEMDAVGLVLKASENRVSDRLMYIFNSVVSLFGKDMEKKIVPLITYSDGVTPENALKALEAADIKCAKDDENEPVYFMFNNRQTTERNKKNKIALKGAWDMTMDQIKEFSDFLGKNEPQKLKKTVEVLNSHVRITACIQNLQERIKLTELKQKEIQQTREALEKHQEEMKNSQDFTYEVDESYKEKETISGGYWGLGFYEGAVTCNVCKENCHYPGCTVAWSPEGCEVMKDGHCTSCSRKCPASDHVKEERRYVTKTKKVKKTNEDMKREYEKGKESCDQTTDILETLEETKNKLQREKDECLEEVYQHVVKLEKIALNANSASTYGHLDFLIEKMKEKGDTQKKRKLVEMKGRMDEDKGVKKAARYGFSTLKAAFKK
ncbi:uncharacterized protein LOC131984465 [Centropristis striata]|uniref:uncharacterized protein LOC131984465 n=1 Tax=Centropristis striata TaxID=184440 RepID=UPI0027E08217|nr:uncharacterized protein LOC131984465 [Centropristis striata]